MVKKVSKNLDKNMLKSSASTLSNLKYILSFVIVIVGILSLLGGTSYALLKGSVSSNNEQVIKVGSIKVLLTENFESIDKNISILEDSAGLLDENTYSFNIKNIGSGPAKYDLKLINDVPSSYTGDVLDTNYIKVGLEINGEEHGPMSLAKVKNLLDSDVIYENEVVNYKMRIWLDESKKEEILELENYRAFFKLKVEASQRFETDGGFSDDIVFNYTGDVQKYVIPTTGYYYMEMAGASGGDSTSDNGKVASGGLGAKTSGYVKLNKGTTLYFYVGGEGKMTTFKDYVAGGYNGGGDGHSSSATYPGASGGGATDVRLVGGAWNSKESLISRIMVAGAGGGASYKGNPYSDGGNGGALWGEAPAYGTGQSTLGRQDHGGVADNSLSKHGKDGAFGIGGASAENSSGGGGAGYYGGAGASQTDGSNPGGAGGSSYISGYAGVNSIKESTKLVHTYQTLHYSGKYFIGASMMEGANKGNGYAKITYVGDKPTRKSTKFDDVRYVKNCISYNTTNNYNHWVEIQAIKDGVNIAKGKSITGTYPEVNNTSFSYKNVVDGDVFSTGNSGFGYASTQGVNQCVTVDLGDLYDLDEVAIWNYFNNNPRAYYNNITSVSSDNSSWTTITDEATYSTSNGIRGNAYTDTYNGYVHNGLMLWYDGYANTGTAKNYTSTTWKNLASSSLGGTLTGGTWNKDNLYFDGTDDWVKIAAMNYATPTVEFVFSKPTLTTASEVYVGNYQSGGYGVGKTSNANTSYGEHYIGGSYSVLSMPLVANKRQTISLSYDKAVQKLYSNGSLYTSKTIAGSIGSPTGSTVMAIGANPSGTTVTGEYFKGNAYSVRIYNRALTADEINHNSMYDKQKFNIE